MCVSLLCVISGSGAAETPAAQTTDQHRVGERDQGDGASRRRQGPEGAGGPEGGGPQAGRS